MDTDTNTEDKDTDKDNTDIREADNIDMGTEIDKDMTVNPNIRHGHEKISQKCRQKSLASESTYVLFIFVYSGDSGTRRQHRIFNCISGPDKIEVWLFFRSTLFNRK
jgi:hypothetical protein